MVVPRQHDGVRARRVRCSEPAPQSSTFHKMLSSKERFLRQIFSLFVLNLLQVPYACQLFLSKLLLLAVTLTVVQTGWSVSGFAVTGVENTSSPFLEVYNFSCQRHVLIFGICSFVARPRCFRLLSAEKAAANCGSTRLRTARASCVVMAPELQKSLACINGSLRGEERIVLSMDLNEAALLLASYLPQHHSLTAIASWL